MTDTIRTEQPWETLPREASPYTKFTPADMDRVQAQVARAYSLMGQSRWTFQTPTTAEMVHHFPDMTWAEIETMIEAPVLILGLLKEISRLGTLYGAQRHHHLQAVEAMEQMATDRQQAANHLVEVAETRNFWKGKGAQIEALLNEAEVPSLAAGPRPATPAEAMLAQIRDILNEGRA